MKVTLTPKPTYKNTFYTIAGAIPALRMVKMYIRPAA